MGLDPVVFLGNRAIFSSPLPVPTFLGGLCTQEDNNRHPDYFFLYLFYTDHATSSYLPLLYLLLLYILTTPSLQILSYPPSLPAPCESEVQGVL